MAMRKKGKVYLVGAGPGDPGLFTLKGVKSLSEADVVICDRLINHALLSYARQGAEIIHAGKEGGCHTMPQEEINRLMVSLAREGKVVVRLKGGDPFIFGRGGEEARWLAQHGVEFQVVPGVTSAIAVPAYAGIPLTHRAYNTEVTFITGHEDPTKEASTIHWEWLAQSRGTLVFLMGMKNLEANTRCLIELGQSPDTPAALIQCGTTARQKTVVASLGSIVELAGQAGIGPPAILVVGDVVHCREDLNWFEHLPLLGRRVVVTRTRQQASILAEMLREQGSEVVEFPTIAIIDPPSWEEADAAIRALGNYDWIIFTSANGVNRFVERLETLGMDIRAIGTARVGAIGPATAEALHSLHVRVDVCPSEYTAEGVLESLRGREMSGRRVLIPRALDARDTLPEGLRQMDATVDIAPVYQTVIPQDSTVTEMVEMLQRGDVDIITFTSSSTVRNFVQMIAPHAASGLLERVTVACIGPVTTRTARELGIRVDVMPEEHTIPALVEAIVEYCQIL